VGRPGKCAPGVDEVLIIARHDPNLQATTGSKRQGVSKEAKRLRRQFDALSRTMPVTRGVTDRLLQDRMRLVRVPTALFLLVGGVFSFLPMLGLWMLPLGLMLLAVDVPAIRPTVSAAFIRARRRVTLFWRQRVRGERDGDGR
jgi:hypothetical protein